MAILGGGPGGYEAALVAAQLGADVTVVDSEGVGGSAVLTDCVPSKTLIATAELMTAVEGAGELGVELEDEDGPSVDLARVNARVKSLAQAQSDDIGSRLDAERVRVVHANGRLDGPEAVVTEAGDRIEADVVLVATGAHPRVLDSAQPDGERILTWEQVYDLDALPERLVVVGSGVTGAEFAGAYQALGSDVVLVRAATGCSPARTPTPPW